MKNGLCLVCESSEIYKSDFAPLQAGGSFGVIYNPAANDLQLEVYLCSNCGHVEISVAEKHKPRLSDLVKSENWKKVTS